LVLLEFLENSNSHSVFEFKGKIKFIAVTNLQQPFLPTSRPPFHRSIRQRDPAGAGGNAETGSGDDGLDPRHRPGVNPIKLFTAVIYKCS
jgi:hypothetical protein